MPAVLELNRRFPRVDFPARALMLGGVLSGFFGGLSGHQGVFRSAFLIRAGLDRDAFVGTGVVSTVMVDIVRLTIYGASFYTADLATLSSGLAGVVTAAIVAAFLGSYLARRLLRKVTLRAVQAIVAVVMIIVGAGLAVGLL